MWLERGALVAQETRKRQTRLKWGVPTSLKASCAPLLNRKLQFVIFCNFFFLSISTKQGVKTATNDQPTLYLHTRKFYSPIFLLSTQSRMMSYCFQTLHIL
jgi:hypothetical protein